MFRSGGTHLFRLSSAMLVSFSSHTHLCMTWVSHVIRMALSLISAFVPRSSPNFWKLPHGWVYQMGLSSPLFPEVTSCTRTSILVQNGSAFRTSHACAHFVMVFPSFCLKICHSSWFSAIKWGPTLISFPPFGFGAIFWYPHDSRCSSTAGLSLSHCLVITITRNKAFCVSVRVW